MSSPARPLLPPTRSAARRAADALSGESPAAAAALGAIFPALAQLLGPQPFAALCAAAVARDDAADPQPGTLIHGLLVRREARTDDRIPSRLAADIAALEWSIHRLAIRPPHAEAGRMATPRDLLAGPAPGCAGGEGWRAATLQPSQAFDIVPVAFRLDTWVRRVHQGHRMKRMPVRGEQHIVVHAPRHVPDDAWAQDVPAPAVQGPAVQGPDVRVPDVAAPEVTAQVWWFALPPGPGTLLAHLALGQPVGAALAGAVHRGWVADEAAALAQLEGWLREGLFARVLPPDPVRDTPPSAPRGPAC